MKPSTIFLISCAMMIFFANPVFPQHDSQPLPQGYKRNVIKWNMTPFVLWSSSNINISYERVLSPHRSFSINAGYFEMPSFGSYDSLQIQAARKKGGFSVSGDYRFYFKKRNTGLAPDGLYWGPYASWHQYGFTNDFTVDNQTNSSGSLTFDGSFNVIGLGVQLGYQFVIKERFTVDLIFIGPSVAMYGAKLKLEGDIDIDEEDEYLKAIRDVLVSKFPFLDELIADREFNSSGVTSGIGLNLRYMIQIGYRF